MNFFKKLLLILAIFSNGNAYGATETPKSFVELSYEFAETSGSFADTYKLVSVAYAKKWDVNEKWGQLYYKFTYSYSLFDMESGTKKLGIIRLDGSESTKNKAHNLSFGLRKVMEMNSFFSFYIEFAVGLSLLSVSNESGLDNFNNPINVELDSEIEGFADFGLGIKLDVSPKLFITPHFIIRRVSARISAVDVNNSSNIYEYDTYFILSPGIGISYVFN